MAQDLEQNEDEGANDIDKTEEEGTASDHDEEEK